MASLKGRQPLIALLARMKRLFLSESECHTPLQFDG